MNKAKPSKNAIGLKIMKKYVEFLFVDLKSRLKKSAINETIKIINVIPRP
jgi:hypothetical protein